MLSKINVELVDNPIKEGLLLLKSSESLHEINVAIVSVSGSNLYNYLFEDSQALNTTCLDVNGLSSGTYFIRVMSQEGSAALKFIVE